MSLIKTCLVIVQIKISLKPLSNVLLKITNAYWYYDRWKGLITLFREIKINFWNVATANVGATNQASSIWQLTPKVSMTVVRKRGYKNEE
jgi:hypothetical protein